MRRNDLINAVTRRLGDRRLVWLGTRGDDIESISDLDQLTDAFCITGRYQRRPSVDSVALEDLTGRRVDLDTFDIDDHPRDPAVVEFRQMLLRALARPSAVFTYRPTSFLSATTFARRDQCRHLGIFKDLQGAFEHKPWVESAVADLGVAHIPWTYIPDNDRLDTARLLADGPVVLRRSRSTGGVGLTRLDDIEQLSDLWPDEDEAYVSVAPFYEDAVPVNVGGVVWRDGVTVHPASIQLIGLPSCTTRPFGYCGNDFGASRDFSRTILDQIDEATRAIGAWLGSFGYLGAFGIDFLIVDEQPLFTEVNPRLQGSTHLSCQLSVRADESCLLLEHLAAFLGVASPRSRPLVEQTTDVGDLSHVVVHWTAEGRQGVDPAPLATALTKHADARRIDVPTHPDIFTESGGTVLRATFERRLTSAGFELTPDIAAIIDDWNSQTRNEIPRTSGDIALGT